MVSTGDGAAGKVRNGYVAATIRAAPGRGPALNPPGLQRSRRPTTTEARGDQTVTSTNPTATKRNAPDHHRASGHRLGSRRTRLPNQRLGTSDFADVDSPTPTPVGPGTNNRPQAGYLGHP